MSQFQNESATPLNSALQSLSGGDGIEDPGWFSVTHEWSNDRRLKGAVAALLITVAAHSFWLRLGGYFGYSCFVMLASHLLIGGIALSDFSNLRAKFAASLLRIQWSLVCVLLAMVVACARMLWQGNLGVAFSTLLLLGMLSLALHARSLEIVQAVLHWLISTFSGFKSWAQTSACFTFVADCLRRWPWAVWGIPIVLGLIFAIPLLFAHPAIYLLVSNGIYQGFVNFGRWLSHFNFGELVVLIFVAAMSMGLLLPMWSVTLNLDCAHVPPSSPCSDLRYRMVRNSLITVVVVFSLFLVLEFSSLWFRSFPIGFDYSGYAHQGAAWLTVALAMATVTLSIMFSPAIHAHADLFKLQHLAKIWMVSNLFMAIAVYYRLAIYVNFNGLTRLRIVGLLGVTCVLAGFGLVLYRVMKGRSWSWLIHRQLWAFLISLFVLVTFPMDWVAQSWNARQIADGNLASVLHFGEQPISDEGLLCLVDLVQSSSPEVRDHVLALFANREAWLSKKRSNREPTDKKLDAFEPTWREFQGSTFMLEKKLATIQEDLHTYVRNRPEISRGSSSFRKWAWQWY